eukprot:11279997-Prorocentrum_lima.AAC.1
MTSSLVGSEMCIRDRNNNLLTAASRPCCAAVRSARALSKGKSTKVRAVSYTHLTLPTICSV